MPGIEDENTESEDAETILPIPVIEGSRPRGEKPPSPHHTRRHVGRDGHRWAQPGR